MAKMVIEIGAKIGELQRKLSDAAAGVKSFWKGIGTTGRWIVGGGMGALAGGLLAAVKHSADLAAKFEQSKIAFEVMVGSAGRAAKLIEQLREYSDQTPFASDKVLESARILLSFGMSAEQVAPTLKMLGDVSAGTGKDLAELSVIFGQIKSTGRLMGGDLLQLINAGFNPLTVMAKQTGKSMLELKKDMEAGLISFDMVEAAFKSATSEGGLFYQMTEKQAQTLTGQLSTLRDSMDRIATGFGGSMLPELKELVKGAQLLADTLTEIAAAREKIASGEIQADSPIAPSASNFAANALDAMAFAFENSTAGQVTSSAGGSALADAIRNAAEKIREQAAGSISSPAATAADIAAAAKTDEEERAAAKIAAQEAADKATAEFQAAKIASQEQAAKDMDAGFIRSQVGDFAAEQGRKFREGADKINAQKAAEEKAAEFAKAGALDALESRKAELQGNAAQLEKDLSAAFRPGEFIQSSLARIGGERGISVSRQSPEVGELQKIQTELQLIEKAIKENGVARWP